MDQRHLRGKGPLLPFDAIWNSSKPYLGLIVGFHDHDGATVYGKVTQCQESALGTITATVTDKSGQKSGHRFPSDAPMRVLTQRKCPWCREMFHPHHQDQQHCTPDHAEAQDLKCRATRKLLQRTCRHLGVTCLSPSKKAYDSRPAALTGVKNSRRRHGTRLEPYLCICERWHLGHPSRSPQWRSCGKVDPTVEDIARFLSAHGLDTSTPLFERAAREALETYWDDGPEDILSVAS